MSEELYVLIFRGRGGTDKWWQVGDDLIPTLKQAEARLADIRTPYWDHRIARLTILPEAPK